MDKVDNDATTPATGTTLMGRLVTMIVFRIANIFLFRGGRSPSSGKNGAGDHSSQSIYMADDAQRYLRSIGIAYSIPCVWKNWNVINDGVQKLKRCQPFSKSPSVAAAAAAAAGGEATKSNKHSGTKSTKIERTSPPNDAATTTTSSTITPTSPPAAVDVIPERDELTKLQTFLGILQQFDTWIQFLTLVLSGLMDIGSKHFVRLSVITAICRQVCESVCHRKRLVVMEKEKLLEEQRRLQQLQKTIWGRVQLQIQKWIEQLRNFFKWMFLLKTDVGKSDEKQKQLTRENTSSSTSSSSSLSSSSSDSTKIKDHHRHHIQHAKRLLKGQRESISDDLLVGVVQIMMVCVLAAVEDHNNEDAAADNNISWMSWFIQNILWILLTSKWKTVGLSWIVFLLTLIENDVLLNPDLTPKQKFRKISWIAVVGGTSGKYVFSFGK